MNLETSVSRELWEAIRVNYERRNFTGAIQDSFYFLSDLLRKKSGLDGDGVSLVGQALSGPNPKIKVNKDNSESEINIQRGFDQILRGLYQGIRNPRSHGRVHDTEDDAKSIIYFIGYLIRQIDQARVQFSLEIFVKRLLDSDFVATNRYSELLLAEIPDGQVLNTFIELYRLRESWNPRHTSIFLKNLIPKLTDAEREQVFEMLSDDLKVEEDEKFFRVLFGSLPPEVWPNLQEVARLRAENKVVKSIEEGRYDSKSGRCRGGSLATWATSFFQHFALKDYVSYAIQNKITSSNPEHYEYGMHYMLSHLPIVSPSIPLGLDRALRKRLEAGDKLCYDSLYWDPWPRAMWSPELIECYDKFKAWEPPDVDDEIPF